MKAYPNPAGNQLNVELSKDAPNGTLEIYSQMGNLLQTQKVTKGNRNITLDLSNYRPGMYLIQFIGQKDQYVLRIMKY